MDNSHNEKVYPQFADFTFYGGLYRDVNLVCVNKSHFSLDYYGGPGVNNPEIKGKMLKFILKHGNKLQEGQSIRYTIYDAEHKKVSSVETDKTEAMLEIKNVHLWHGRKDPYLYRATIELVEDNKVIDNISSRFGCRTFEIHPENGFILNGEQYPLRGVCRHQDRLDIGNALLRKHHDEDMQLICETGSTTIRLAHYQHDQYFYDLCDQYGMVVWAEIPYISQHNPAANENTISQMKELVIQNYNHPSIVTWGLSMK